jgi:hypothetical protein
MIQECIMHISNPDLLGIAAEVEILKPNIAINYHWRAATYLKPTRGTVP